MNDGDSRGTKPLKTDVVQKAQKPASPFGDKNAAPIIPWVLDLHIGDQHLIQVQVREQMVIGRGAGAGAADVDLTPYADEEHGVSRRHAILLARSRFLTIRDLGSTNGTYVNGLPLKANQDVPLEHGDVVTFGRLETRLMFAVLPPHKRAFAGSDYQTLKPVHPGTGKHVLIVEDDADVALAYQMMLRTSGYRVTAAPDPTAAAEVLMDSTPDAIILDVHLSRDGGDFGGLDVLHLLQNRTQQTGYRVPTIVVSGAVDEYHRKQATEAGATLFLPKPVRVDELAVRVGMLIQQMGGSART
jgi:CheY-like chemotaxis protein